VNKVSRGSLLVVWTWRGPKVGSASGEVEIARLQRENKQLQENCGITELIIDVQKNCNGFLLGGHL